METEYPHWLAKLNALSLLGGRGGGWGAEQAGVIELSRHRNVTGAVLNRHNERWMEARWRLQYRIHRASVRGI